MASDPQPPLIPHARPAFWQDRILWLLLALAVVGASIYLKLDKRVFPAASIDLKYSREQIATQAVGYAKKFGYVKDKPIESTTFTFFNESKTFLEYELGLDEANRLMREKIPVWAWTTRFCQQYQLEQFRVWISPQGKLIAFSRTIEDERPMPTISHADALSRAQTFLVKEVQAPLPRLKLVRDETTTKAHRDDFSFTWEDDKEDFKGAKLRYYIAFSGDQLTAYSSFLFIPDNTQVRHHAFHERSAPAYRYYFLRHLADSGRACCALGTDSQADALAICYFWRTGNRSRWRT